MRNTINKLIFIIFWIFITFALCFPIFLAGYYSDEVDRLEKENQRKDQIIQSLQDYQEVLIQKDADKIEKGRIK